MLSAASAAGATYLFGCTITRRSREAGGERRRDAERGGKCSFFLWLTSPRGPGRLTREDPNSVSHGMATVTGV